VRELHAAVVCVSQEQFSRTGLSLSSTKHRHEKKNENNVSNFNGDYDRDDEILSFEECLIISKALGDVKQNEWVSEAEYKINQLEVVVYESLAETVNSHTRFEGKGQGCTCLIILYQYEENDVLRKLPCGHAFHICCADQWLMQTNACPCCRKPIDIDMTLKVVSSREHMIKHKTRESV